MYRRTFRARMSSSAPPSSLWHSVDRLLVDADTEGIVAHGLGPLAAELLRRRHAAIPAPLLVEQRASRFSMLSAVGLVEHLRAVLDGPIMLLKGPEAACRYPSNARRYRDVDILVPDAGAVHASLITLGFEEVYEGLAGEHHHLEPLRLPTIPLLVEVHSSPNWLPSMSPPRLDELLEAAVPSSLGVAGVLAPAPLHHTLMLASHAWRDEALRRARDLVDVAAMAEGNDRQELDRLSMTWGMQRVWRATRAAMERLFYDGKRSVPLRTWARHLEGVRERTVLEHHATRWLHPFWELPPLRAVGCTLRTARSEVAPAPDETWREKATRALRAARNPNASVVRDERGRAHIDTERASRHRG